MCVEFKEGEVEIRAKKESIIKVTEVNGKKVRKGKGEE